jgi:hypothetical protein
LKHLEVGGIRVPGGSTQMVASTLLHIFPRLTRFGGLDERWEKVLEIMEDAK